DLLNDRVPPFYDEQGIAFLSRADRPRLGYCGRPEHRDKSCTWPSRTSIIPARTRRAPRPRASASASTRGCWPSYTAWPSAISSIARSTSSRPTDLDTWLKEYNEVRTHQGRWYFGMTPMHAFIDSLSLAKEKLLQAA